MIMIEVILTQNDTWHVFLSIMVFLGYMPSSGIIESYGSFIPIFLRNYHTFSILVVSIYKAALFIIART